MAVTLEAAIVTLQTMFPALDAETLEEVLKQQGGHMENTVEILLGFASEVLPLRRSLLLYTLRLPKAPCALLPRALLPRSSSYPKMKSSL